MLLSCRCGPSRGGGHVTAQPGVGSESLWTSLGWPLFLPVSVSPPPDLTSHSESSLHERLGWRRCLSLTLESFLFRSCVYAPYLSPENPSCPTDRGLGANSHGCDLARNSALDDCVTREEGP